MTTFLLWSCSCCDSVASSQFFYIAVTPLFLDNDSILSKSLLRLKGSLSWGPYSKQFSQQQWNAFVLQQWQSCERFWDSLFSVFQIPIKHRHKYKPIKNLVLADAPRLPLASVTDFMSQPDGWSGRHHFIVKRDYAVVAYIYCRFTFIYSQFSIYLKSSRRIWMKFSG